MLGEDLINSSTGNGWYISNARWIDHRNPTSYLAYYPFEFYYKLILNANFFLESIDNASGEDQNRRIGVKAEALCFRAWSHFQVDHSFMENAMRQERQMISLVFLIRNSPKCMILHVTQLRRFISMQTRI